MVTMMMMMQNEATASSTRRAWLGIRCPRRGERRGEEKCLCCGIYLMCIIKGIGKQALQLSCSSCVREGGHGVPCGHLFPDTTLRVRPALPGLQLGQLCPTALLCWRGWAGSSGNCWDRVWDKRPGGKEAVREVAQRQEEAALVSAHCPAALQCPRLPWAGDELLWASKGVPLSFSG